MIKSSEISNPDITKKTKNWIEQMVIGLNLCPFAAKPYEADLISIEICGSTDETDWIHFFIDQCNQFINRPSTDISSIVIVYPLGMENFETYLDIYSTFEDMLHNSGLDEVVQLASFHPKYTFAGTKEEDVTNYTNRSPHPIVQLLRVDEVERAIEYYGDTSEIFTKNIAKMKELGIERVKTIIEG